MNIYEQIIDLDKKNKSYTLATVIKTSGSVPGKVGFKMVIVEDNNHFGTVGGGELELTVIKEGKKRLNKNENGIEEYKLTSGSLNQSASGATHIPMSCEGNATIFYEVHKQKPTAYVFGGGHVGQALLNLLAPLGYHSFLIDNRPEIANKNRNPGASDISNSDYLEYISHLQPLKNSFAVILTQGHQFDYDILKTIYHRGLEFKYIGIIASKTKAFNMIKQLKSEFGENVDTSRLSTPVGLNIGGNTAEEIALSIAAEIQSVRYDKILIPE
jgi:xanthine dehydrogenase accessory factor